MKRRLMLVVAALLVTTAADAAAQERWTVDLESGGVFSGRNDARIPGDTGTKFSLVNDLESDTAFYWRARVDLRLAPKHVMSALVAPLAIDASGRFDRPVFFEGATFAPGTPVVGRYEFNSYRVTYRYEPLRNDRWLFGVGVTGKIRDAVTRLESGDRRAEKSNVGFVPLVNFKVQRQFGGGWSLLVEGDALAAPQGRAEDVFAGVLLHATPRLSVKAGYRLLEGGADNDEVYTFAALHYAAAGVVFKF